MKKILINTKNFVKEHKVAIAVSAVAVTLIALQTKDIFDLNEFLDEKGLLEEYYHDGEI